MPTDVDVVVVGGGIAGGAISTALSRAGLSVDTLEIQDVYRDLGRGEWLSPWGFGDAERLGVGDAFRAAKPTPLERWILWDEIYEPGEAPCIDMTDSSTGARSPHTIHHFETSRALTDAAQQAGAVLHMGVRELAIAPGREPRVSFRSGGRRHERTCRLVIGAGGKYAPTAKLLGIRQHRLMHHWGGSLAVEGLDGWPTGVQAMGTEERTMFHVFPQEDGRARLYLNYPIEDKVLYAGPDGTRRFIEAFDVRCLPVRDIVLGSRPVGGCMNHPSWRTSMSTITAPGVVLVGDEAGVHDTVLGTGLSCALRDSRVLVELLLQGAAWTEDGLRPYVQDRERRMVRMHTSANFMATLYAEFGPEARDRRRRVWDRMWRDPRYMVTIQMSTAGPDVVPRVGTSRPVIDHLLGDAPRNTPRIATAGVGAL